MEMEDKRLALKQEWDNFRYQDGLRWSKIQTIAAIEAAFFGRTVCGPRDCDFSFETHPLGTCLLLCAIDR